MSDKFEYKYVAPTPEQRREIESIKEKYSTKVKTMTEYDKLKKIDRKVQSVKLTISISFGIIGTLLFGTGLTFFLEWQHIWYFGIPFALIGSIMVFVNYPIYLLVNYILVKKYKYKIIELANVLLEEDEKN